MLSSVQQSIAVSNMWFHEAQACTVLNDLVSQCRIRDETMLELGVRLEDRGDESVWKLEDPIVLRREQQAKQQDTAEQKLKKLVSAHSKKQAVSLHDLQYWQCDHYQ